MKLSIAIVTMNRSVQLIEALQSCVLCDIPSDTQFIIVDNASTDDTVNAVRCFFAKNEYDYCYELMEENLGAGKGRNIAFRLAKGEYVYYMDDDAYIDASNNRNFFIESIRILDSNKDIMTLTTQIYDLAWQKNRVSGNGPRFSDGLRMCYMVCGGSHFLRSSFFTNQDPFFENKYGYEELQPSLRVSDADKINAFAPDLIAIHNPKVNKWNFKDKENEGILITEIANQKAIKGQVYSRWFYPIVCIAYMIRSHKHLNRTQRAKANQVVSELVSKYDFGNRIRFKTVIRLYRYYGSSIF